MRPGEGAGLAVCGLSRGSGFDELGAWPGLPGPAFVFGGTADDAASGAAARVGSDISTGTFPDAGALVPFCFPFRAGATGFGAAVAGVGAGRAMRMAGGLGGETTQLEKRSSGSTWCSMMGA
jgi:hypothetical protein